MSGVWVPSLQPEYLFFSLAYKAVCSIAFLMRGGPLLMKESLTTTGRVLSSDLVLEEGFYI